MGYLTRVSQTVALIALLYCTTEAVKLSSNHVFPDLFSLPWLNTSLTPSERATLLINNMTFDEKVHLLHGSGLGYVGNVEGIDRLAVPPLRLNDGPQGFRDPHHSGTTTQFPSGLTIAATWDTVAANKWGKAMGTEFFAKGANVQLGPGVCVARVPHNGRNFEYISGEDPFLGASLVGPAIAGIQATGGVIANVKHFVDNSQETARMRVTEIVTERQQFELYYPPFEAAIKAGVGSLMCSYNRLSYDGVNHTYSCEHPQSLQRDLKERLGFTGWVMSDWFATHSTSINKGLDMEMPDAIFMGDALKLEVLLGNVNVSTIEASVRRILTPMFKFGVFDIKNNNSRSANVTSQAHCDIARELAASAMVLLKNKDNVLPLKLPNNSQLQSVGSNNFTVAVIGDQASNPYVGGLGSGEVVPSHVVAPVWSLRNNLGLPQPSSQAESVSTTLKSKQPRNSDNGMVPECNHNGICLIVAGSKDTVVAKQAASSANITIIFLGTTSSEGEDRTTLGFGSDDALVSAVAAVSAKTVVMAVTPGAFLLPWRDEVDAIIAPFMPGQEYGNAAVDVLMGTVNPSAKLPLTLPTQDNQINFTKSQWPGVDLQSTYSEGLEIGYRWYDSHNAEPAFPFGHGLSYTTFGYEALQVSPAVEPGGDAYVAFDIINNGTVTGSEVVQLYLGFPASAGEPPRVLKGFEKIQLTAKQKYHVSLAVNARARSIWNSTTHAWQEVKGNFDIFVGGSSRDIALVGTLQNSL